MIQILWIIIGLIIVIITNLLVILTPWLNLAIWLIGLRYNQENYTGWKLYLNDWLSILCIVVFIIEIYLLIY